MHKREVTSDKPHRYAAACENKCPVVPLHERRRQHLEELVATVRARLLELQRSRERLEVQSDDLWQMLARLQRELHACRERLASERRVMDSAAHTGTDRRDARAHWDGPARDRWISQVFNRLGNRD
ncbi:MAG: hypothetical protein K9M02_03835 [Thiohalocapsa sp.]|nr:hypothetical protein [Thiohalocapsa sp.]